MIDLSTTFMGLKLKNPIVASASPLSKRVEVVKRLEESGVSAVVMYSLFEEQINNESKALDHFLSFGTDSFQEFSSIYPDFDHYNVGPDGYLEQIAKLKQAVKIPIIASLNGVSKGGWIDYARKIQQAGADALELNLYYIPTRVDLTAVELEQNYIELIRAIRAEIQIPMTVKLSSAFSSLPNFVSELSRAGAKGVTLFNRFLQPDFDLETMEVNPHMVLSTPAELRLPLRWTAILFGKVFLDIALTTGVHSGEDVVKAILAGANITMIASELVEKGPARAIGILEELTCWMVEHEYHTIDQMKGAMSQKSVAEPAAFERGNYMKSLQTYDNRLY
jgi:dihydroorotate dehydrogenase (fumarate)